MFDDTSHIFENSPIDDIKSGLLKKDFVSFVSQFFGE